VTFPFVTVILTWTGPYRVSAASPVTVLVPVELADPEPLDVDGLVVGLVAGFVVGFAVGFVVGFVVGFAVAGPDVAAVADVTECVLKPSSTTSEATVLTIASRTRRMVCSFCLQSQEK
jgi:hypothetical protein